jgi:cell division protein FtsW (lipid II flippase)
MSKKNIIIFIMGVITYFIFSYINDTYSLNINKTLVLIILLSLLVIYAFFNYFRYK